MRHATTDHTRRRSRPVNTVRAAEGALGPVRWLVALSMLLLCAAYGAGATELASAARVPSSAAEQPQRKFRLALYQGGEYVEYVASTLALLQGLQELGWMPPDRGSSKQQTLQELWRELAATGRSQHLEFVADAFYEAGWDNGKRAQVRDALIRRLREQRDIDAVLALGTWAGQDLANDAHDTPVLVISASDAVDAGIVKSVQDSGFDHVHAHIDPDRIERQIRLFHEAIEFERLGVAYEDTPEGRSYAGVASLRALAEELEFELVACHTVSDHPDIGLRNRTTLACINKLATSSDALYLTEQGGINESTVGQIAQIAMDNRVPTFSQRGTDEVRFGILLSMSRGSEMRAMGQFHARTLGAVLNGARPRDLAQVFEIPSMVALNLETARRIGFVPSAHFLAAADELYDTIHSGE